ncbi:MAG TPA: Gfo/Idh/MocA family oxidoreductase [Firmicutes bacterium]|nr:Gfo/Idh/MocA family oxidoreductase [Bacillota bacterium]
MKSILVVGGGGIGERHVRCFLATGRAEVSVCDANPERLAKLKESYPVKATFNDFDGVDLAGFDGVLIATPANMHISMAMRCAEQGVPFLVEKPLSVNMDGVDRLIESIRGIPCGVAYVRRSMPSFRRLKELAGSGIIGRLRMGRFNFSQDYRKYRPDYQRIYYAREDMGGGCILDAASHSINLAQWFFGEVEDTVAFYDRLEFEGVEVEDSSIILLRFREGRALVELFTNQFQQPNLVEIELIGNQGNLRYTVDGEMHTITFCNSDANKWEEMGRYRVTRDDPFIAQAHDFLNAIEGTGTLPTSIEEGKKTLAVALAAKASQRALSSTTEALTSITEQEERTR